LDREFLVHPGTHLRDHARLGPFIIVEAQGIYLRDVEGRQYIDGVSCLWNVNIGHGRKEIAAAVAAQMETLDFSPIYYSMSHPPAIRLAERIAGLTPGDLNHIYFTSTGSEANESAFKIARYYWRLRGTPERYLVISRNQGYHGTTMGALSATGLPLYRRSFGPLVPGYLHIPAPYCYRCELNKEYPSCDLACARALEDLIAREGPAAVAAVVAEPVQGTGGVIVPPPEYLPLIAKICAERGVLLIFDEIITGFGRTGKLFGAEHWGLVPDMMTFAKGVSSGYLPLGGVAMSETLYRTIAEPDATFFHGYTYNGHPVTCAAALKNLEILLGEGLVENAARSGEHLQRRVQELLDLPGVGNVRGLGLMAAVELVGDKKTRAPFDPALHVPERVRDGARDRGLYCRSLGESIALAPPLITTTSQIDDIVDILRAAILAVGEG
jgi:adenosylmethionine-8-amino-7-oxononanoate aminotransferase